MDQTALAYTNVAFKSPKPILKNSKRHVSKTLFLNILAECPGGKATFWGAKNVTIF